MEKLKRYLLAISAPEWNHDADEWIGEGASLDMKRFKKIVTWIVTRLL